MNTYTGRQKLALLPVALLLLHFFMLTLYLVPSTIAPNAVYRVVNAYVNPFFTQNWSLFTNPSPYDLHLNFKYYIYRHGQKEELMQDATQPLMESIRQGNSAADRISYFLSNNINGVVSLSNSLLDSIQRNPLLLRDSLKRSNFYNVRIEKSLYFRTLFQYSGKCFSALKPPNEQKLMDSAFVTVMIMEREIADPSKVSVGLAFRQKRIRLRGNK